MLSIVLFWLAVGAASIILLLSLASASSQKFQFWPPPNWTGWQRHTSMILFRGFVCAIIALTVVEFESKGGVRGIVQYAVGAVLMLVGLGPAVWITAKMGWRRAYGEKSGLMTAGWFARSRNPVYVVTWIGIAGWALIANSLPVTVLLAVWAVIYLGAVFLEEPWLEAQYGDAYRKYKSEVPRFL